MTVFFVLRLFFTLLILFILKTHSALLVRVLFPSKIKHKILDFKPRSEITVENYLFKPLTVRVEYFPLLFKKTYDVYYCDKGVYLDMEHGYERNKYLLSVTEDNLMVFTRSQGLSEVKGKDYYSVRTSGKLDKMVKKHFEILHRESMGLKSKTEGTPEERLLLTERWYNYYVRSEIWSYSIISGVIVIMGLALIPRIWGVY